MSLIIATSAHRVKSQGCRLIRCLRGCRAIKYTQSRCNCELIAPRYFDRLSTANCCDYRGATTVPVDFLLRARNASS